MKREHVPPAALSVCQTLNAAGHQAVVVGGCVRDVMLGRTPHDWDVATSAMPNAVMNLFAKAIPTGLKHGTVTVVLEEEHIEVTTFRTDGNYADGRRPDDVKLGVSLEEDLARRDFTVNAMAFCLETNQLIDPFLGRNDILFRTIRAVGRPFDRFMEDGLRMMRAVRFAATLDFEICPHTREGIGGSLLNIQGVSQERIRDELVKLLSAEKPSVGLRIAQRTGLLWKVLPELEAAHGHAQNSWHKHDVFEHTLVTVDNTEGDPLRRMGALLHDVGKPASAAPAYQDRGPGMFSFHNHDEIGADIAQDIVERLKFSNDEKARLVGIVRHHMFGYGPNTSDKAIRRMVKRCGIELIPDLIALRVGDIIGKGLGEDPEEKLPNIRERIASVIDQIENGPAAISTNQLAISGHDIMTELGLKPGKEVGDILRSLLERVIDDPGLNEREALLSLLPRVDC